MSSAPDATSSPQPSLSHPSTQPSASKWDSRISVFLISSIVSAVVATFGGIGTSAFVMWTSLVRLEERISAIPKVNVSELREEIISLQERVHVLEQAKIDVTALNNINTNNTSNINSLTAKVEVLQQTSQGQHVRLNNIEENVRTLQGKASSLCEDSARLKAQVESLTDSSKSLLELRERVAKLEAK